MNIDEQLNELKSTWQDTSPPDAAELAGRIRTARIRARLVVATECVVALFGATAGGLIAMRDGWFATAIGITTIALSAWALYLSVSIRRRGRVAETQTVRGQVRQLRRNALTSLSLVRGAGLACLVAAVFVVLIFAGSVLELPGAPLRMGWPTVFGLAYIGAFAAASRAYGVRVRRQLDRLRAIEASLDEI